MGLGLGLGIALGLGIGSGLGLEFGLGIGVGWVIRLRSGVLHELHEARDSNGVRVGVRG